MNSLLGFGGLFNTALTAKQGYNVGRRNNLNSVPTVKNTTVKAKPVMNLFRSPFAKKLTQKTKAKTVKNNLYVPSTTEMPEVNLSYVKEINWNGNARKNLFANPNLTNAQRIARNEVKRKMVQGIPVTFMEKFKAGMVTMPKPKGPKPVPAAAAVGGKWKTKRRHTNKRR